MSRYVPPSLRKRAAPAAVEVVSSLDMSKGFPILGHARVAALKKSHAASWSEISRESVVDRTVRLQKENRDLGWENLRTFYYTRPEPKPYVTNDERYEAYLAEQDYLDAVKYDQENPLPEPVVQEWTTTETRVVQTPKQQTMDPLVDEEMTDAEIRERIQFLIKRTRRNGLLREDREAYEKEIRDLQTMLYDSD